MSGAVAALLDALAEARSELLAAIEGATQADLVRVVPALVSSERDRWDVGGLLWYLGLLDDWTRLVLDQALDGRPTAAWRERARPTYVNTPELLSAWLEQTRAALLARARRVTETEFDRELVLSDGARSSPRQLLQRLVEHDRERTVQVRPLLERPGGSG